MKWLLRKINIRINLFKCAYYLGLTLWIYSFGLQFLRAYLTHTNITLYQVVLVSIFGGVVLALRWCAKYLDASIILEWEE